MEETKIEKLEETETKPEEKPEVKEEFNYEKLADMIIERQKKETPKIELAEKKTAVKASSTNENKELSLHRQYRHLSNDAIKHLVMLKDNRKFITSEDGLTVAEVEEKW